MRTQSSSVLKVFGDEGTACSWMRTLRNVFCRRTPDYLVNCGRVSEGCHVVKVSIRAVATLIGRHAVSKRCYGALQKMQVHAGYRLGPYRARAR
jgi:hypothetical protein